MDHNEAHVEASSVLKDRFVAWVDAAGAVVDWCQEKAQDARDITEETRRLNASYTVDPEEGIVGRFKLPIKAVRNIRARDIDTLEIPKE